MERSHAAKRAPHEFSGCFHEGYLCSMCNIAKAAADSELSGNGQSCCCSGVSLSCVGQIWGFLIRWQYAQA